MKSCRAKSIRQPRGLRLVADYKKRLDKLCREVVMLRDHSTCQWCGSRTNIQWAHITSRRYLSTRWSLGNSLALCAGCHLKWHHRPLEAASWFNTTFRERALALRVVGHGKIDPHGVFLFLQQEKKRLESEADKAVGS